MLMFNFEFKNEPLVLQDEVAECGLASVAMILQFYGSHHNLHSLRKLELTSPLGADLEKLKKLGESQGLIGKVYEAKFEDLQYITLPAIAHWNENHFVVIYGVSGGEIRVNDPAIGKIKLNKEQFLQCYSGVCLELVPDINFKREKNNHPRNRAVGSLFSIAKSFKKSILNNLMLSVSAQIFVLLFPLMYHLVIDTVIRNNDKDVLLIILLFFVGLAAFNCLVMILREREELFLSTQYIYRSTKSLVNHLCSLPITYFESRKPNSILSKVMGARNFERRHTEKFFSSFVDIALSISILAALFFYNLTIALIVLVTIIIYLLISSVYLRYIAGLEKNEINLNLDERMNLSEVVSSIQTVKLYSSEDAQIAAWDKAYMASTNNAIKESQITIIYRNASELAFNFGRIALVFFSVSMALNNEFTVGQFFAVFLYANLLKARARTLIDQLVNYKRYKLRKNKTQEIFSRDSEFSDSTSRDKHDLDGSIKIRSLGFKYPGVDSWIIKNGEMIIRSGEFVAIVGSSGGGKTTLLKLLLGLYVPKEGKIIYSGKNLNKIDKSYYRKQVATVMQGDTIFSMSILNNIALFDEDCDIEKVKRACKVACIDREIESLPMKYNTHIRAGSGQLSGGQVQRILLARAIYKNPKIIFMDEATSYLDNKLEISINNNLANMEITRVVIAHRLNSIKLATKVYVIESGKITENNNYYDQEFSDSLKLVKN